jgi:hypothetical protein
VREHAFGKGCQESELVVDVKDPLADAGSAVTEVGETETEAAASSVVMIEQHWSRID